VYGDEETRVDSAQHLPAIHLLNGSGDDERNRLALACSKSARQREIELSPLGGRQDRGAVFDYCTCNYGARLSVCGIQIKAFPERIIINRLRASCRLFDFENALKMLSTLLFRREHKVSFVPQSSNCFVSMIVCLFIKQRAEIYTRLE
jgi:hypothetical protein